MKHSLIHFDWPYYSKQLAQFNQDICLIAVFRTVWESLMILNKQSLSWSYDPSSNLNALKIISWWVNHCNLAVDLHTSLSFRSFAVFRLHSRISMKLSVIQCFHFTEESQVLQKFSVHLSYLGNLKSIVLLYHLSFLFKFIYCSGCLWNVKLTFY